MATRMIQEFENRDSRRVRSEPTVGRALAADSEKQPRVECNQLHKRDHTLQRFNWIDYPGDDKMDTEADERGLNFNNYICNQCLRACLIERLAIHHSTFLYKNIMP